jgi:RNA polymerase sigma-70 factor (ECF subfamily)
VPDRTRRVNNQPARASQPGEVDDGRLVERARAGDRDAFRQLVVRHQGKAYAVALGIVKHPEDARELTQEAFVKAWRSLAAFHGESAFYTWLYRIVSNLAIDHLRRVRPQVEYDDMRPHEETALPDDNILPQTAGLHPGRALEQKEIGQAIARALDGLSDNHRAVLLMREVEGLSYRDMATAMGCTEGTIMSRLFHARKRMQAALAELREGAPPDRAAPTRQEKGR